MKQQLARLAGSTLTYGVGSILSRLLSFLLLPLFTAYLTPADYGVVSMLGILGLVAMPVFSLGLGAGIGLCYFAGNTRESKEATIWTAAALLAASAAVLCIVAVVFAGQLSILAFQTPEYTDLVTLTLFGVAAQVLATPFPLRLQFEERARLYALLSLISTAATLGLSVLMVAVLRLGVVGYVQSTFLGQCIYMLLYLVPAIKGLRLRLSRPIAGELLRLGIPLIPSFAFLFVLQQGNKYILQLQSGIDAVGIYTIGFSLGFVMGVPVGALQTAWYPFFMSFVDRQQEAKRPFAQIATYYALGFGALTVVFFATARLVVMVMTRPAFYDAYFVVGLSAAAQLFQGAFSLLLPGVYFARAVRNISIVQGMAAILSVLLSIVLIHFWGVLGAALALASGYAAMAALMHVWNVRQNYFQVSYEGNRLLRIFLVYAALCAVALWHRSWPLPVEAAFTTLLLLALGVAVWILTGETERNMLVVQIQSRLFRSTPLRQEK